MSLASAIGVSSPAEAQALIEDLRSLAETHPAIQMKGKAARAAEEGVRAARAGYLPTVALSGDSGAEYVDNPTRRTSNNEPYYRGRETSGLVLTQKIFDGWATDAAVGAAAGSRAIAETDLRLARQSAFYEGTMAYLNVLRFSKLIQLAGENERNVQAQLNLEDERVQKGAGITSDVLAAKQRLQIAKEKRVGFEGSFQEAVAMYTQVFGRPPEPDKLSDPPTLDPVLPKTLDEAVKAAEQESPMVERAGLAVEVSGEQRRTAQAGYYPTLDLVGRANYENDKNALIGVRRDFSLLLTANWELFSGFKTDAQVAQAAHTMAATKDDQVYQGRKVEENVRKSWHRLKVARERTELLENAANLAEAVWQARRKEREAGKATVQEVLDEETRVNDARIAYTLAYYDGIFYGYELANHIGRLEVETLSPLPPAKPSAIIAPLPKTALR
jgi:outer membrane protein, adhesin transport system